MADVRVRSTIALDREREAVEPLALLLELRGRQCIGGVRRRVVEHRLDPADDAQSVGVGDWQQVLQCRRAIEMMRGIGDPDIEVAEVSPDRRIDDRRRAVRIRIVPIAVEDHQPGSLAPDAVERRAGGLGETTRGHRQPEEGADRPPEAADHARRLCLILGTSLQVGAQPKWGREECEEHHS